METEAINQLVMLSKGLEEVADDPAVASHILLLSRCPHCMIARPTLEVVWETRDKPLKRRDGGDPRHWKAYACSSCAGVVTVTGNPPEGTTLLNLPLGGITVDQVFPSLPSVHPSVPPDAARYLGQALETQQSPDACVLMCAAAIDAMLKGLKLTKGSLYERLELAVKDQLVPKAMAQWAHVVRLDANASRHADGKVAPLTVDEASRAVEFTQAIAQYLYVLPSQMPKDAAE